MNLSLVILVALSLEMVLPARTVKRGPLIDIHEQDGGDTKSSPRLPPRVFPRDSKSRKNAENDQEETVIIPFIITGEYERHEQELIFEAMDTIAINTCVRFSPRTNEKDYVNIRNEVGEGCFSSIGMEGGEQFLDLEASILGSCMSFKTIIHELLHTVGLDHEHSRYDRDDYVEVLYDNVRTARQSQFNKSPYPPDYDIPYDYNSIMHYGQYAFTKNGQITLKTKDPHYQDIIGTAREPSTNDYLKVCAMYSCRTCMGKEVVTEIIPPEPTLPTSQNLVCKDVHSVACHWALSHGILQCDIPFTRDYCCATCRALSGEFDYF